MKLSVLTELTWRLYQNGKAFANNQKLLKDDISQKIKILFADFIRQRYYESKKLDSFDNADYSFTSPLLNIKRFKVEHDNDRFVRCDMGEYDLYRMPNNSHFSNVYPIGKCGANQLSEITQVAPGEENFYVNDPDLSGFIFFVVKGRGINVYNLPSCVEHLDIETTYDTDDADIDKSMASVIVDQVLNVTLAIKKQYYSEEAQKQIEEQNVVK